VNVISELRQRIRVAGKTEISVGEFNQLQAEWIRRALGGWQPISTAPRDGTRILVHTKGSDVLPERSRGLADITFVARNDGDASEWRFAAPVGMSGIPDDWLAGWMPEPAGPTEGV
jgi:hypothetical protein